MLKAAVWAEPEPLSWLWFGLAAFEAKPGRNSIRPAYVQRYSAESEDPFTFAFFYLSHDYLYLKKFHALVKASTVSQVGTAPMSGFSSKAK